MKFFLDTANVEEIKRVNELGLVDGVTTNPTLISREGKPFEEIIKEITNIIDGPVSAEVVGIEAEEMIEEARSIAKWAENIVIKIPMTEEGLKAVKVLADEGIKTNVTLIFTVAQGLMATKAGASYISPFIGRLDDISSNGIQLVQDLRKLLDLYNYDTEIIAASIRNINHLEASAAVGAHIATIPGSLFPSLWSHPLTDKGIQAFLDDWNQYEKGLKEK